MNKCPVCRKIQKLDPSHPTVPEPYRPLAVFLHQHFQGPAPADLPLKKDLPLEIEQPVPEPTVDSCRLSRRRRRRRRTRRAKRVDSESSATEPAQELLSPQGIKHRRGSWSQVVGSCSRASGGKATPKRAKLKVEDSGSDSSPSPSPSRHRSRESRKSASPSPARNTLDDDSVSGVSEYDGSEVDASEPELIRENRVRVKRQLSTKLAPAVQAQVSKPMSTGERSVHVQSLPDRDVHFGSLSDISVLLEHAKPGTFFALDIDDTLHISKHHPCMLLSHQGIRAYQYLIRKKESYRNLPREVLEERRQALQSALNAKRLVQPCTAEVVRTLQDKGCWVFGLTSRYSEMADRTTATLLSLGIDLSKRSPFPVGKALFDPRTEAVCKNGIIYTNATNKAVVLDRFLEKVVFRTYPQDVPVPVPEIVFVDDRMENIEHLMHGLHCAAARNIKLTCYRYQAASEQSAHAMSFDSGVVLSQVAHFIEHMEIIPDHEALRLVNPQSASSVRKLHAAGPAAAAPGLVKVGSTSH